MVEVGEKGERKNALCWLVVIQHAFSLSLRAL